ncbi:MAG: HD domain-containing protein [Thermoproteota archaeon]
MSHTLVLLTGKRAPLFKDVLIKSFPEFTFEVVPKEEFNQAVIAMDPVMAIVCTSDITNNDIEIVNRGNGTLFLFILPEYTKKLQILSSNPFFDFVTGDISDSELRFRVEKLNWLRYKLNEYKSVIADIKATKYNLIYELSRIAEIKGGMDGNHLVRVAEYSSLIAREIGLTVDEINNLFKSAISHDVGKIVVPDYVLLKNTTLEPHEKDLIKQHTIAGAEIIEKLSDNHHRTGPDQFIELAREIALFHHESPDGSGYPYGLKLNEIPVSARIVKVADVYDALLSTRHYKPAWNQDDAFHYLSNHLCFDQECVRALRSVIKRKDPVIGQILP